MPEAVETKGRDAEDAQYDGEAGWTTKGKITFVSYAFESSRRRHVPAKVERNGGKQLHRRGVTDRKRQQDSMKRQRPRTYCLNGPDTESSEHVSPTLDLGKAKIAYWWKEFAGWTKLSDAEQPHACLQRPLEQAVGNEGPSSISKPRQTLVHSEI